MGWGGRREEGSGWGTHVNPWLIHANLWQKPLQYCKVISLQLIKINEKKFRKKKKKLIVIVQRRDGHGLDVDSGSGAEEKTHRTRLRLKVD